MPVSFLLTLSACTEMSKSFVRGHQNVPVFFLLLKPLEWNSEVLPFPFENKSMEEANILICSVTVYCHKVIYDI